MTLQDRERLARLEKTFELNFRLTQYYALYLERMNEVITEEMMDALTEGGIPPRDAFAAILCEIFGLDMDGTADDRRLIRDYIMPSVRVLDPKKYTENPYYANIKIPEVKNGRWELRLESYPPYRGVICDDMMLLDGYREIPPLGFFEEKFAFPAVLEDGNEWMTLTPVDLDTCDAAVSRARGRVVTFGLGLGYYAYMCSRKPEVDSVTVVERSEDVISLFRTYILPQFDHPEKVEIICADAFEYAEYTMPGENFDLAFVDTWRDASDGTPMYLRMRALEHLSPRTEFMYWIENFLISRHRAERFVSMLDAIDRADPSAPGTYDQVIEELEGC